MQRWRPCGAQSRSSRAQQAPVAGAGAGVALENKWPWATGQWAVVTGRNSTVCAGRGLHTPAVRVWGCGKRVVREAAGTPPECP